ncbi:MAG TPA: ribokinase [Candidatus Atribacteria bacterium]|nr:ribokinase [Candidatus Atribacteria bacterium]
MDKSRVRILVVGSINMDLVMSLERAPEAGETVLGDSYTYIPGGKGANQAVAAARLGAEVTFCGRVGDDANGEILLENLRKNGVDTAYITKDKDSQTGLAAIPVDATGQNRIIVFPGANGRVSKEDVDKALEQTYDAVMMQLEIPLETVYYTYKKAAEKGIPVILDAGPAMKVDLSRFEGISVISPNESEASAITGIKVQDEESALEAARYLARETKAGYVLIKLGSKGALLYEDGRHEIFPAFKVKAVDTTAAGDSFTAAMTLKMIEYGDIRKAMPYANAVGAICVSRMGAQPSLPTAEDVAEFMAQRGL